VRVRLDPEGGKGGLASATGSNLQTSQTALSVALQPGSDGIAGAWPQQTVSSDIGQGPAVGNFEDGGSTFTQVGFAMVVTPAEQTAALGVGQR